MLPLLPYLATSYWNWSQWASVHLSRPTKSASPVAVCAITTSSKCGTPTPPQAILSPKRPTLANPCAWTPAAGSITSPSFKLVKLQSKLAHLAGHYKRVQKDERAEGAWEWEENLFVAEEEDDFRDPDLDSLSSDDSLRSSPNSLFLSSPLPPLIGERSYLPDGVERAKEISTVADALHEKRFEEDSGEEDSDSASDDALEDAVFNSSLMSRTYAQLYPGEEENDDDYFAELPTFVDTPLLPSSPALLPDHYLPTFQGKFKDKLELDSASSPIFEPAPVRVNLPPSTPRLAFTALPYDPLPIESIEEAEEHFFPTFVHLPSLRKLPPLPRRSRKKLSAPSKSMHREVVMWASWRAALWLNDWQKANSFEELREW